MKIWHQAYLKNLDERWKGVNGRISVLVIKGEDDDFFFAEEVEQLHFVSSFYFIQHSQ